MPPIFIGGLALNIEKRHISELKPAEYNPRKALCPDDAEYQKISKESSNADRPLNTSPLLTDDGMLSILEFNGVDTVCFACGKYVNLGVEFISKFDPDYIRWCLLPSTNLSEQTKKVIRKEIQETIPDLCAQLKS